ncbi:unnamed protein product, partial [Rotaria sp. Silwood1]
GCHPLTQFPCPHTSGRSIMNDCSSTDDEQYCVRTVSSYWKSGSMQVVNQLVYQMSVK